jgi:Rrf2 family nitric oxide-sensitive transcriptional repressor
VNQHRPVPLAEIARSYGISHNHLVKVAGSLVDLGLVTSVRGRSGGFQLAQAPERINVGWLIRRTEPDFHLVECFDRSTDTCPITPACKLRHVLFEAQKAFFEVLDGYSLADFPATRMDQTRLVALWSNRASTRPAPPIAAS